MFGGVLISPWLGIFNWVFGERRAAVLDGSEALYLLVFYLWIRLTGRGFKLVLAFQVLNLMLYPFAVSLLMGGFSPSGGRFIWAFLAPVGVLVFRYEKTALVLMAVYVALLAVLLHFGAAIRSEPTPPGYATIMGLMHLGGVSIFVFFLLIYYLRALQSQREKTESLLLNVLPREIADSLRERGDVIADSFEEASVLFADIAGFSKISNQMAPEALVALLDEIFSHFDLLSEKYGLEKIKTIGDCYMVAAGVPKPRPDHVDVICDMALEMRDYFESARFENGLKIQARIGINSGPLVAGVIGRRKFIYDLWGDTVNVASRTESSGLIGEIRITGATWELAHDGFVCDDRRTVAMKGMGEIDVWRLLRRKEDRAD